MVEDWYEDVAGEGRAETNADATPPISNSVIEKVGWCAENENS